MGSHYKIRNTLKNLSFYIEKLKIKTKTTKNLVISDFYLNYHFFPKNLKNELIINCQKNYHSFQKDLKS